MGGQCPFPEYQDDTPYENPNLGSLSKGNSGILNTCDGTLNKHDVSVLLDSGAEGIFVDRKFVPDDQLTGKMVSVKQAEGPPLLRPLCHVQLNCPYFQGSYLAVALENPTYDVYLGQVPGPKPFPGTKAAAAQHSLIQEALPRLPEPLDTCKGETKTQEAVVASMQTRSQK